MITLLLGAASSARAAPLGAARPAHCVAHTSFSGGPDAPGDYRCAGLAIDYHTGGVGRSPFKIWAGQWLFVDESGQYRVGSCTFNKGVHPTTSKPSHPVSQRFPNDPTGALGSYLTWRYGDTHDDLTAAAMWAVLHYYAQDAAGTNRASNGWSPLVPSLQRISENSGSQRLEDAVLALHDEAVAYSGEWTIAVAMEPAADRVALVVVTVRAGGHAVPGIAVELINGADVHELTTDDRGQAAVEIVAEGGVTAATATALSPGGALVYRGTPAASDPDGAQTLITAGDPVRLIASASIDSPAPTTTTTSTTTTTIPPTTTSTTTTTIPPTTTSTTTTTVPPTTTISTPTTIVPTTGPPATTTGQPVTAPTTAAPPAAPPTPPALPRTGAGDGLPAFLGTALLVAGIGLLGTVRRRVPPDRWQLD